MKPTMATAATAPTIRNGHASFLARQESRGNDEEPGDQQKRDRETQVSRTHPHPFVVEHAERSQFLIHRRLELPQSAGDAGPGLCQRDLIEGLALVAKGEIEDGRFFRGERLASRPAMQREVPLAPLARFLGDRHDVRSARAKSDAIACWSEIEPLAARAPATPGRSVSGGVSTVPSKRSVCGLS